MVWFRTPTKPARFWWLTPWSERTDSSQLRTSLSALEGRGLVELHKRSDLRIHKFRGSSRKPINLDEGFTLNRKDLRCFDVVSD